MDDADVVQLLHHVQDADAEVHDEWLRHGLVTQGFIDVHCVLKVNRSLNKTTVLMLSERLRRYRAVM